MDLTISLMKEINELGNEREVEDSKDLGHRLTEEMDEAEEQWGGQHVKTSETSNS